MKANSLATTVKAHGKDKESFSDLSAKTKKTKTASVHTRSPQRRSHDTEGDNRGSRRRIHKAKAEAEPIRSARAKKWSTRRKAPVGGLENWHPQQPIHVGGVMNRGPQNRHPLESVPFAGVGNRSYAAHLNDVHTELHPKSAVNPLHGPFPARLKQP
jgi:hypothetical protein